MPKKNIEIQDIGEAVNYQAAIVKFLNKNHKVIFHAVWITMLTGLALGVRECATQDKVKVKELLPIGSGETFLFPTLTAQSKQDALIIDKDGNIIVWGKPVGSIDKNYALYKLTNADEIIVFDKIKNKVFKMDIPASAK